MFRQNKKSKTLTASGFTIVELLIVIVIIGILATISLVAYSGIQHNAASATTKSSLANVVRAFKLANVGQNEYPTTFPDNIKIATNVGVALTQVETTDTFCINVTTNSFDDIKFHADQTEIILDGLCDGDVIEDSILGDYNTSGAPVASASGLAVGELYGFKVTTSDDWTVLTLSWDSVTGTSKYQVQTRNSPTAAWYIRTISSGSGSYSPTSSYGTASGFTGAIPSTTNSMTWTTQTIIPYSSGQTFEYQLRPIDGNGDPGAWSIASLNAPDNTNISAPDIKNFMVSTDTNWDNLTLSWDEPSKISTVPKPIYQLQSRNSPTDAWYWRYITNGSGSYSPGYGSYDTNTSFTGQIPTSNRSLVWNYATVIPYSSNQTFEYRVRVSSSAFKGVFGDWNTVQLASPSQSNTSTPTVTQFNVTADPSWANVSVTWSDPAGINLVPHPIYQIQTRSSPTAAWYWRYITTGSGSYSPGYGSYDTNTSFTGQVPITTHSLTWTAIESVPYQSGQTFEYRIRVNSSRFKDAYGPWTTVQLHRP